jgi:hypothetical protein
MLSNNFMKSLLMGPVVGPAQILVEHMEGIVSRSFEPSGEDRGQLVVHE